MLASANPDKVAEIVAVLSAAADVELVPRPPEVPEVVEDAETLVGNARLKARALVEATGLGAVADDTGLEVDALGGAPGVFSARYAGEDATYADNVAKLLGALAARPDGGGRAPGPFKTVALAAFPDGSEVWAEGVVEGTIALAPRGEHGFGYDPVFVPDGGGRADLRRDGAGREGCHVAPGPGLPGPGGSAGGEGRCGAETRSEQRRRELAVGGERERRVVRDDLEADVVRPRIVVLADALGDGRGIAPGDRRRRPAGRCRPGDVVVVVSEVAEVLARSWAGSR